MSNSSLERQYIWCGPVGLAMLFIGWIVTGYFPPPSPNQSAAQIQAFLAAHDDRIRVGLIIIMFGIAIFGPWVVAYAQAFRRIEGPRSLTADLQFGFGILLVFEVLFPCVLLEAISINPHQPAQVMVPWFDAMWIPFIGFNFTYVVETILGSYAILRNPKAQAVFPRWFAWLGIAAGGVAIPATFSTFAKTGPLAWNGAVGLWIPTVFFGAWFAVATNRILRAQRNEPVGSASIDPFEEIERLNSRVNALAEELSRAAGTWATPSGADH